MISTHQNRYLETSVQTATRGQLLIMLYDGAIRYCKKAIEAIRVQRLDEAHTNFCRVQDIIRELAITLDLNSEISGGLVQLYDYFIFRLIEANTKKSAEPAEEVLGYLVELKGTWLQAIKLAGAAKSSVSHG